jgi:DNA endonuclease
MTGLPKLRPNRGSTGEWRAKHDSLPPRLVDELYSRTRELAADGLGPAAVASRLHDIYSLSVSPGTLRHWIVGDRKPTRNTQRKNIFRHGPSRALSYIIGANIGDGCTLVKNWCVKLEVTDFDFASTFNANMATLFSRTSPNKILTRIEVHRLPMYIVKYSSKQLAKVLRLPIKKLLKLAFVYPSEFLRGFFDAEGHVDVCASKYFKLSVGVENSNRWLLTRVKLLLNQLDIASRLYRKREAGSIKVIRNESFLMKRTSHSLVIGKMDDVKRFAMVVDFSIHRKAEKLEDALSILRCFGAGSRPTVWKRLYSKEKGEWVRRSPAFIGHQRV